MDIQRKMVCTDADGAGRVVLKVNGVYQPEETTTLDWVLAEDERFKPGASYGIAVWLISEPPGT